MESRQGDTEEEHHPTWQPPASSRGLQAALIQHTVIYQLLGGGWGKPPGQQTTPVSKGEQGKERSGSAWVSLRNDSVEAPPCCGGPGSCQAAVCNSVVNKEPLRTSEPRSDKVRPVCFKITLVKQAGCKWVEKQEGGKPTTVPRGGKEAPEPLARGCKGGDVRKTWGRGRRLLVWAR